MKKLATSLMAHNIDAWMPAGGTSQQQYTVQICQAEKSVEGQGACELIVGNRT